MYMYIHVLYGWTCKVQVYVKFSPGISQRLRPLLSCLGLGAPFEMFPWIHFDILIHALYSGKVPLPQQKINYRHGVCMHNQNLGHHLATVCRVTRKWWYSFQCSFQEYISRDVWCHHQTFFTTSKLYTYVNCNRFSYKLHIHVHVHVHVGT